jgi:tetratricopeptide (TPR) repeat protein
MHEVVRRHFLPSPNQAAPLHKSAADYYKILYDLMKTSGGHEPGITTELAHHLALCGNIEDLRLIRPLTDELKVSARLVYRTHKQYELALCIYQALHELKPDDLDVLAYIGRCFGRRHQWDDCEAAFGEAIQIARTLKKECGWLYRDWGHILARYQLYGEARLVLAKAEELSPNDASIIATNAYMAWREGDYQLAEDLFERALAINQNHTYSLNYFSMMLRDLGRAEYSNQIKKRLDSLEEGTNGDLFVSDELDDEDEF